RIGPQHLFLSSNKRFAVLGLGGSKKKPRRERGFLNRRRRLAQAPPQEREADESEREQCQRTGLGCEAASGHDRCAQGRRVVRVFLGKELVAGVARTTAIDTCLEAPKVQGVGDPVDHESVRASEEGNSYRVCTAVDVDALAIGPTVGTRVQVVGRLVVSEMEQEGLYPQILSINADVHGNS